MTRSFDSIFKGLISEMAVTLKSSEHIKSHLDRIEKEKLAHHYQKNLMRLKSKAERDKAVEDILNIVFDGKKYNPDIHTRKQLQDALGKAAAQVLGGGKTFNDYLGKWMGTNLDAEIIDTSDEEKGASEKEVKDAVKDVVNDVAAEVTNEEPKTVEDAAQQLKLAAKEETEDSETDKWRKAFGLDKKEEEPKSEETDSEEPKSEVPTKELNPEEEYRVFESSYESILEKVQKANKRAYRYGIPQIVVTKTGEEFKTVRREYGKPETYKLIKFKISQPSPKMSGGWKFIARVDHEPFGNMIVKAPGTDEFEGKLHEMFGNGQPSYCDHCKKKRNRTSTFIVQDEQGALKRIGKACLKDYLPGGASDVQKLIHWGEEWVNRILKDINILRGGGEYDDEGREGRGGKGKERQKYFSMESVLSLAGFIAKTFGFLSATQAGNNLKNGSGVTESTADKVKKVLNGKFTKEEEKEKLYKEAQSFFEDEKKQEEYIEKAKKILDWAPAYVENELNNPRIPSKRRDYLSNVKLIVDAAKDPEKAYVSSKHIGYLVGLISSFNNDKTRDISSKNASNETQGPGDFVGIENAPIGDVKGVQSYAYKKRLKDAKANTSEYPYNGPIRVTIEKIQTVNYGRSYGYGNSEVVYNNCYAKDEKGNAFVWPTGSETCLDEMKPGETRTVSDDIAPGKVIEIVRAVVSGHSQFSNGLIKNLKVSRAPGAPGDQKPLDSKVQHLLKEYPSVYKLQKNLNTSAHHRNILETMPYDPANKEYAKKLLTLWFNASLTPDKITIDSFDFQPVIGDKQTKLKNNSKTPIEYKLVKDSRS